jgi:hypothetical protein
LAYSGDLFSQIQKIIHENQIQKIKFSQTITFSLKQWRAFSDKTAIKRKNAYYDEISFRKFHSKVITKVVKDDLKNKFCFLISQILKKSNTQPLEKKGNFLSKHLAQRNKINVGFGNNFKIDTTENHNTKFNLKIRTIFGLQPSRI